MRAILLVALVLLAGGLPPAAGQATRPAVEDAPDDAREGDTQSSSQIAVATACRAGRTALSSVCPTLTSTDVPQQAGGAAPAALEALAATFADDPDHLSVTLDLAGLDEALTGTVSRNAGTGEARGAIYNVCWSTSDEPCVESVTLGVMPDAEARPVLLSFYSIETSDCNDDAECAWSVPFDLTFGAPGRITWQVPRAILADGAQGAKLVGPQLKIERYLAPTGRATWPVEDGFGYGVSASAVEAGEDAPTAMWGYTGNHRLVVDESEEGDAYTLSTAAAAVDIASRFDTYPDLAGDVVGDLREDIDILGILLAETDTNLTFSVEVARVDDVPEGHYLYGALGLPTGRFYTFGYGIVDGQRQGYADVCAVPNCHDMPVPHLRNLPLDFEVTPGTPGWVNATFARSDLGNPKRGDLVNFAQATMFTYNDDTTREPTTGLPVAPPVSATVVESGSTDTLAYAPPWWFHLDTTTTLITSGFTMQDELGDVEIGGDSLAAEKKGRFDITYLEAFGRSSTTSRITLGIADLGGALEAPAGYRGFTYVIGLQLSDGTSRMVGFYYEDSPAGTTLQDYFCADDTAVFGPSTSDPKSVPWTSIPGVISAASGIDTTGAGQRGSITFNVPHETCFLQEEAGPVDVIAIAARTFLLPANELLSDAQGFRPLDTAESDESFTLQATEIVPPGPPWYAEPFGIASFWDIFGITVVPLITLLIGLFALRRRRRILERYLKLIDQTVAANEGKPKELEAALGKIRHQLKEDLVRDRIQHGHFTIADRRIEEARGKARVSNIADAFEELPHRLLRRLEELLADGLMSREDYRVFSALLEEAPLTPEARASIRRKLLIWVREDAEEAKARTVPVDPGPGETKRPATLN